MSGALLAEWSRLLVRSLVQAGLRHAVVCPGSRSTPFAWAIAEEPSLAVHVLIDERVAGFFALGLARVSGEPALVLSTSGSAAANFFPAIVEASLSHTPLLVLTADRPLELQGIGAAQTLDQLKMYGDFVRDFVDLGAPEASPGALASLQRSALQALVRTRAPLPGPVHLNARARKPLEPAAPESATERETVTRVTALIERGPTLAFPAPRDVDPAGVSALAARLRAAARGVIVCGPLPLFADGVDRAVSALAARLGMPLYAEATSQLRFSRQRTNPSADALDWLLSTPETPNGLAPELVLRFGATPTSSALERLLSQPPDLAPELHVVVEHGHSDPSSAARTIVNGPPALVAERVLQALGDGQPSPAQARYETLVQRANGAAWQAVDRVLERSTGTPGTSEARAVRAALEAMPEGSLLVVGNSLPVREVDAFVPASARGLRVASQRGVNGIDGLIAGAAGAALAARTPALLLIGDVSVAHDLGGLAAARKVTTPLGIVILDNDGGRIFDGLPVARLFAERPQRAELWLTPPRLQLEHAAALFGVPYVAPASVPELRTAVESALEHAGVTLVHVRVLPRSTEDATRAVRAELARVLPDLLADPEA